MDPSARTIVGLLRIVEREWSQLGHRFATRTGVGASLEADPRQQSPVWLLFLDSLFQIHHQNPRALQWTPQLLILFADAPLSGRWRTFSGDSVKLRPLSGQCFLTYILRHEACFTNALFHSHDHLLTISTDIRRLVVWDDYWLRYVDY